MEPRVFNVLNYGAVGNDNTDNTAAFSSCLTALIAAGGGRMYLPAGVYRGNITIPAITGTNWIALEIVGESQPAPIFGTVGAFHLLNNNSIVNVNYWVVLGNSGPSKVFTKNGGAAIQARRIGTPFAGK